MTATSEVPSRTPPTGLDAPEGADLLSDLLGTVHISGAVLFRAELGDPWAVAVPDGRQLAAMLPFQAEHLVPFHLVDEGTLWLQAGNGEGTWLSAGDAVLMPYGTPHRIGGHPEAAPEPMRPLPPPPWRELPVVRYGGPAITARIVCGFVHCEELLFDPFLRGLPPLLLARPGADPSARWLENTIRYAAHEANNPDPGSRSVLPRLTELMFVEVLRHHMRTLPEGEVGWLAAANDPVLGKALAWLHRAPVVPWTVDQLARRVGVSRTALADRFVKRLGQPPMRYLARWRLQVGAQLLRTTSEPLKRIAEQVGYESEAAFGRAFRRLFRVPPAEWRRRSRTMTGATSR